MMPTGAYSSSSTAIGWVLIRVVAVHAEGVIAILHVLRLEEDVGRVSRCIQETSSGTAWALMVVVMVLCGRAEVLHRVGDQGASGRVWRGGHG